MCKMTNVIVNIRKAKGTGTLNLDPLFLYTPRSFDSLENGPFFQACTRLFRLSRPALEQLSPMSRGLDELRRFTRPV